MAIIRKHEKMAHITMSLPELDESDIQQVIEVIKSKRLALGPLSQRLENLIATYIGTKNAVAVSSGTAALHILVKALDVGPGDEVLVPSFTFCASVNTILYERAIPVFVDIEPDTYNLNPDDLRRKVTPRTKAIMAVDVFGHPAEWDEITRIAKKYGLKVIDDSCEAIGAEYKGKKIGKFGNAAAFAFYPNKQMTTGEGGIIVTDDDEIAKTAKSLRNQGRDEMGAWLQHEKLGFNYRMDEMSAALGVSQIKRLDLFLKKRESVAKIYAEKLKKIPWVRPSVVKPYVKMSWFVYVITLEEGMDRDEVITKLEKEGVPARGYFSPVHLQPYIRKMFGYKGGELPVTEYISKRTLALPFHNNLTEVEIDQVVDTLARLY